MISTILEQQRRRVLVLNSLIVLWICVANGFDVNKTNVNILRPNIIYVLVDDWGWADADWHRDGSTLNESATPFLNDMLENGIELDQFYAYKFCSPSRSAIQSGRNPIHVNVQNYQPIVYNPSDPDPNRGFAGIPVNMTCMAEVLKEGADYRTHFVGKWDCGMATRDHLPSARGYDTSLFYFHHDNDYWTSRVRADDAEPICPGASDFMVDLWDTDGPAYGMQNPEGTCKVSSSSPVPYPTVNGKDEDRACVYEDVMFHDRVLKIIREHSKQEPHRPLFLFWSTHVIHGPLQVPRRYYDAYEGISDERRKRYLAMVRWLDDAVSNVTAELKRNGMYENTLIALTSDNGGPIYFGGQAGANNYPLKGGKTSNWQGGIRVNAMLFGGIVPSKMRGRTLRGLGTVWDFYATFAALAGVENVTDRQAARSGLPPLDSINLWPYFSGQATTSPRTQIPLGSTTCVNASLPNCFNKWGWGDIETVVAGLIEDRGPDVGVWKLLVDENTMSGWTSPYYPNASTAPHAFDFNMIEGCGSTGCLFQIDADPSEYDDRIETNPEIAREMLETIQRLNRSVFSPNRGPGEAVASIADAACDAAINEYGGFWGPFFPKKNFFLDTEMK